MVIAVASSFLLGSLTTYAILQRSVTLKSLATVKFVGVEAYEDSGLTKPLTQITWGMVEPSENKDFTCYMKNPSNVPIVLTFTTSNWQPANTTTFITLSWSYDGSQIPTASSRLVVFTLHIAPNIVGIAAFSFDITIIGSG